MTDHMTGTVTSYTTEKGCAVTSHSLSLSATLCAPASVCMHRCLQVPELVSIVCSHLQGPRHWEIFEVGHPKRGDLAVLARTSTVFSSHALRLIWNSATLMNLLSCLPSDSFELRTTGEGYFTKYIMQLLRPLQNSDFERVHVYAPLVQHLFSDPNFADLSSVFPSASPWLSENMLPNLQGLYWMHGENDFQRIDHFLTPQLTTIRIPHTSLAALKLLSSLALQCPQLTDVTLFPSGRTGFSIAGRIHGLDVSFEHLSHLPGLRHLRLGELPSTLPTYDDEPSFPSLQTLYFSSEIESPFRFLEWGNQIPLVGFTAECPAFSTADEVHRLFSAAVGGISHFHLTEFAFDNEFDSFDSSDSTNFLIRSSSLRSLFCFVKLVSVSVLSAVGIDLDDPTVTDMARSWRHIECLELQSYYGTAAPRTTLQCLEAFPKYCPHLSKLSIAFDALVIPTSPGDLSLESLKHLDVEASPYCNSTRCSPIHCEHFPESEEYHNALRFLRGGC
ncbi:hypothetical protein MVEN_00129900 [Mycena venus]|uniref:F-box domain-containing protein n=1 Tax=Mycena venus TaxID=2733690 RepID=A0A8H6ZAC7_9AGAR|nr:hypothetical protein MVEN_00129900 [Mycena venus]